MPKLSKRKRQLKDIHVRKGDEVDNSQAEDEEDGSVESGSVAPSLANQSQQAHRTTSNASQSGARAVKSTVQSAKAQSTRNTAAASHQASESAKAESSGQQQQQQQSGEKNWVQCNRCEKWRSLPLSIDPGSLPEVWTCDLNKYDPDRMYCDAPEEDYSKEEEQLDMPLKAFLNLWVKRLKNADRGEARLGSPPVNRNKKRRTDCEWIQCSNPSCGKWRALTKGIESANLIKRLNKNKRFGGEGEWFCSMNSWDDTTASCSAPQEPLWNTPWNLANKASSTLNS